MEKQDMTGRQTADRIACYEILNSAKEGEVVTYERLSRACLRDIQAHRGGLDTARRQLEKEGKVFAVIRNVGLRLRTPHEGLTQARGDVNAIGRRAKRGLRRASHVDTSALNKEQTIEHAGLSAVMADAARCVSARSLGAAKQKAIDASSQISIPEGMVQS
jgi:hypothetical protein